MRVAVVVGLVVVVGVGLVVYEFAQTEDLGDRAEAIVDDPERFVGERVTISGEVEKSIPTPSRSVRRRGATSC